VIVVLTTVNIHVFSLLEIIIAQPKSLESDVIENLHQSHAISGIIADLILN
jgi:hypothetical protein